MGGVICTEPYATGIAAYEAEFKLQPKSLYMVAHDFDGWKNFTMGYISEKQYLKFCNDRAKIAGITFHEARFLSLIESIPSTAVITAIKEFSKSYIVGVVSNHPREWFDRFWKKTGLDDVVTIRAVSGYLHVRKPDVKIFLHAIKAAGVNPRETVYIDDRADMIAGIMKQLPLQGIVFDGDESHLRRQIEYLR